MIQDATQHRMELQNLDRKEYPALYKMLFVFWQGKLFRALEYFWQRQDTDENQHYNENGYQEFLESRRYSAAESTKLGFKVSSDHMEWQHYTILLHCLGLITTQRYWFEKGKKLADIKAKSIEIMKERGHRYPPTYITTQLWTPEKLEYSEAQAMKWVTTRVPIRFVTKEAIIKVYGKELADQVFNDDRGTSNKSLERQKKLSQIIARASRYKGYTTKAQAINLLSKEIGRFNADRVWAIHGEQILSEAGYRYHRPSKADKAKYGIRANDNRWIIDKVESETLAEIAGKVTKR